MKRVSGFIGFLLAVFVAIFLLSLLLPSRVTVSKSVEISALPSKVIRQITDFDAWKGWYPAFSDQNTVLSGSRAVAGVLQSVTLDNHQGRKITFELTDTSGGMVQVRLRTPGPAVVTYQFILTPKINDQTQLTWNINTELGWYPWQRIRGIFLDKFSGDQYEAALQVLKKTAEN